MNSKYEIKTDWDKIAAYLSGNASIKDCEAFEKWLDMSEENRETFEKAQKVWAISSISNKSVVDTDAAWTKLNNKAHIVPQAKVTSFIRDTGKYILRIAAVVTLGLVAWYFVKTLQNEKQVNAGGAIAQVQLIDGSVIDLNKNASIRYPLAFKGNTREVFLEGEAFFNIARDTTKPFIIHTSTTDIRVLGTSFNVLSDKNGNIEVVVKTGVVSVSSGNENSKIVLNKNEKGVFRVSTGKLVKSINTDFNYLSWKTHKFVFREEPLSNVFKRIHEVYDVELQVSSANMLNSKLTATYDSLELTEVVKMISETFGFKATEVEKSYKFEYSK
jgi:transmembrane sensor